MAQALIARKIHFNSGHRYAVPEWSPEQNRKEFGLCFSEHGHGHNFTLEAFFKGQIDPDSGMVLNLRIIDEILKKVIEPLDHHFLNTDVFYFKNKVPTTENIAVYCFEKIKEEMDRILKIKPVKLHKVCLYESVDLWAEFSGEWTP